MAESDFYDPTYYWQKRIDGLQKKLTALQSRNAELEANEKVSKAVLLEVITMCVSIYADAVIVGDVKDFRTHVIPTVKKLIAHYENKIQIGKDELAASQQEVERLEAEKRGLVKENNRLIALIWRPYIGVWLDEVMIEAAHQKDRWGEEHDEGKEGQDWFWLIGYLAGKALRAFLDGDMVKARHHTVSSAAVLANWAAYIEGEDTVFRPGLGADGLVKQALTPPGGMSDV